VRSARCFSNVPRRCVPHTGRARVVRFAHRPLPPRFAEFWDCSAPVRRLAGGTPELRSAFGEFSWGDCARRARALCATHSESSAVRMPQPAFAARGFRRLTPSLILVWRHCSPRGSLAARARGRRALRDVAPSTLGPAAAASVPAPRRPRRFAASLRPAPRSARPRLNRLPPRPRCPWRARRGPARSLRVRREIGAPAALWRSAARAG
jgi:hypothetical protein